MENSKHSNYKNENIEIKYLNNMWKTWVFKVKNNFLELEKYFVELKGRELKFNTHQELTIQKAEFFLFVSKFLKRFFGNI